MDITKMTRIELKALAYDQVLLIQQSQNNLNVIQAQIQKLDELEQAEIEKRKGMVQQITPEPIPVG